MKMKQIIEDLSSFENAKISIKAILAAKENWQEFLPVIIDLMEKFEQERLTEKENCLLFIGILLLVEEKQFDLFEKFTSLCDGGDEYEAPLGLLLGDSITEGLSTYFYVLANGRHKPLVELLQSKVCGIFIRNSALYALFSQYESGQISKEALTEVVDHLLVLYKKQNDYYLIGSLSDLLVNYQLQEFQSRIIELMNENCIESMSFSEESIINWTAKRGNEELLASGQVEKQIDVINEIKTWLCYEPAPQPIFSKKKTKAPLQYITPGTKTLGRNEPCHCGSGKKHKKCCL